MMYGWIIKLGQDDVNQALWSPVPMFPSVFVRHSYCTEVFSIPYIPHTSRHNDDHDSFES